MTYRTIVSSQATTISDNVNVRGRDASATATGLTGYRSFYTDQLSISANATAENGGSTYHNTATAYGVNQGTISFSGTDLDINAYAYSLNVYAYGANQSILNLSNTSGVDVDISATGTVRGDDPVFGLNNSTLSSQGGNDVIVINALSQNSTTGASYRQHLEATGLNGSTIESGAGNDQISINSRTHYNHHYRIATQNAHGLVDSVIDAGSGHDVVTISASGANVSQALFNSTIRLGDGNDQLSLTGRFINSTVEGGKNTDVIILSQERLNLYNFTQNDEGWLISGNGNSLALSGVEEIRFMDGSFFFNNAPERTGTPVNLVPGREDTSYMLTASQLLQGYSDVDEIGRASCRERV